MEGSELMRYPTAQTLTPIMNVEVAKARLIEFQKFVKEYMIEGIDYGTIPGTPKPTLYKPGADKLCELYGLADSYRVIDRVVDFDRGLFDYEIECTLMRDGVIIATGLGSCSSFEGKYRWRESKHKCPLCQKEAIIPGKPEYGGGFICFGKKGGCGAKFPADDERITGQVIGQVENDDIATLKNTILKMAKKRSKIDATLSATRSSGQFDQDLEEIKPSKAKEPPIKQPQRTAPAAPAQPDPGPQPPADGEPAQQPGIITKGQISRLWAKAYGNTLKLTDDERRKLVADVLAAFGYQHADKVRVADYDAIIAAIEAGTVPTSDRDPLA
jgi:hypothetical protein